MRSSRTCPGALEGDTAQINQLINSGATVSSTVQALDSQVGQIIGNLNQVLTALASRSGRHRLAGDEPPDRLVRPGLQELACSMTSSATCRWWRPTWPG